jgi:two-component system nitrogen regulation sensor histidine kinase NtrY
MATANEPDSRDGVYDEIGPPLPGATDRDQVVGLATVILAMVAGLGSYLVLTGLTPIVPRTGVVLVFFAVNLLLIVAMLAIISRQVTQLRRAWIEKVAGARLHARIVALFSIIAALPALLLALAATTTFSRSIDGYFNRQTRAIVDTAMDVTNTYLEEHGSVIRTDILNMAKDLDEAAAEVQGDLAKFRALVLAQASLRDLPVAYVIDAKADVLVAAVEDVKIPYLKPPKAALDEAMAGRVPLLMPTDSYRVAALVRLNAYPDTYLFVARGVAANVMALKRRTEASIAEYEQLRQARGGLHLAHATLYFMISLTALLSAVWIGMWFAGRIVAPIRRLITASQQVARGDFDVDLPIYKGEGDLRRLSLNFNNMASQLGRQRNALVTANAQLLERRRFMEALLSGVSAGVLGLDAADTITIANRSAEALLGRDAESLVGKPLAEALPEFSPLLDSNTDPALRARPQHEVALMVGGVERTFAVRLTREAADEPSEGAVLTFDDVTDLVAAQRTSAWADIARRIAHEIKNPLTPIQLSAERIRRKYGTVIKDDREVFDKCTETIIRQVGDVARMVDEFSSFARMPKPEMADIDLRDAVRDAVLLYQMGDGAITYGLDMPQEPIELSADRRLISQALTNLIKNAGESVQSVIDSPDKPDNFKGRVETRIRRDRNSAIIEVIDNGTGLPKQGRTRLLEPYVTTKGAKGTGLGLSIVQKIIEQHGGALSLEDAPVTQENARGALVRIVLPIGRGAAARPRTVPEPAPIAEAS